MMEFKDFEQALTRLEAIVSQLERGDLALEEALKLFEEGMGISKYCGQKLEEAERRVAILTKNAEGDFEETEFDSEGSFDDAP